MSGESSGDSFQVMEVRGKIAELQEALLEQIPSFPVILRDIHEALRADPDVVTLLEEEEIAVIVKGMEAHAGEVIVSAKAKAASGGSRAKKAPITAADL